MRTRVIGYLGAFCFALLVQPAKAEVMGLDEGANFVTGQLRTGKGNDLIQFRRTHTRIWLNQGDGTFTHKVYVPSLGYAVGNAAEYLKGDFNGDARTDFMHCLGRYVNTWLSQGDGTFRLVRHDLPSSVPTVTKESQLKPVNIDGADGHDIVQFAGDRVEIWMSYGNGDFHHHSFTPWPGYAVGDGTGFIKGLFTGGAKEHLMHLAGTYAHTWLSDGVDDFTLCTFHFPQGYFAPNATRFRMLRQGLNGASDLVQFLDTYSVIWTNTGNCTFALAPFTPVPGYGVGNGADYVVGNFNGDNLTDLLHIVTGGTRYLHPWFRNTAGTFDVHTVDPGAQWDIAKASSVFPVRLNADKLDDLVHITNQDVRTWITLPGGLSWNRYQTVLTSDYEFLVDSHSVYVTGGGRVYPAPDGKYKLCLNRKYDFKAHLCNWGYHGINAEIGVQWYEDGGIYPSRYDTGVPNPLTCYDTATFVFHGAPGTRTMSVRVNVPTVREGTVLPEIDTTNNLYTFPPADWGNHPGCQ